MIFIRRYNNLEIKQAETWQVTDKTPSVDIIDETNGIAICIEFGKEPKITVFNNACRSNFGDLIFNERISNG